MSNPEDHASLDAEKQPRRLIGIALLPSAATLGNLICGFFAILCCIFALRDAYVPTRMPPHPLLSEFFPSYVTIGVNLIIAAMIFDALDGRLARLTRRTSEFGAQLDSLSDIVSFGAAPAMLFIVLLLRPVDGVILSTGLLWRFGLVCALIYVSCAAIRLARYNAENVRDESRQNKFSGLPSPGAAAAFVATLALHENLLRHGFIDAGGRTAITLLWIAALAALSMGLLMVSRLDYVHVFNIYVRRKQPPTHLIWLLLLIGLGIYWLSALLVVVAYAYVLSGLILNLLPRTRMAVKAATATNPDLHRHTAPIDQDEA